MTKILILSDIHGNANALEAVLAAAPQHDALLCLGDVVGYGARPNQCCEILREQKALTLMGNHDAAALGLLDTSWFNSIAKAAILWTENQLSAENRSWLAQLQPKQTFPEWEFQAVHGSLRQPLEEYITGSYVARSTFKLMEQPLCFFGHTHVAEAFCELNVPRKKYRLEEISFQSGGSLQLNPESKYLFNPGSVGQPRDGNPQARAAIFEVETKRIEVFAVDYDIEGAANAIIEAGLPEQLAQRLSYGR